MDHGPRSRAADPARPRARRASRSPTSPTSTPSGSSPAASRSCRAPQAEALVTKQRQLLVDTYGDEGRQILADAQAYADGINAYWEANGIDQPPATVNDVIAVTAFIGSIFGAGGGGEAANAELLAKLRAVARPQPRLPGVGRRDARRRSRGADDDQAAVRLRPADRRPGHGLGRHRRRARSRASTRASRRGRGGRRSGSQAGVELPARLAASARPRATPRA